MKAGLVSEGNREEVTNGVIQIVNSLSDYYEEDNKLYPEVVLIDNLEYFDSLPVKLVKKFQTSPLSSSELCVALKMCAPMTSAGWHIFMEIKTGTITWGVITTLLSETSIPLGYEVLSDRNDNPYSAVYIRNTAEKTVTLYQNGGHDYLEISLTLDGQQKDGGDQLLQLCKVIISNCQEYQEDLRIYLTRMMDTALKTGHGNLILVIDSGIEIPEELKKGVNLIDSPIDFLQALSNVRNAGNGKDMVRANFEMHNIANLACSMMNHDGITVFNTSAQLIGYHYIIENKVEGEDKSIGGSRTKAYEAMKGLSIAKCAFMKKQEGEINIYCR